jgi:small-conductance mechanosensitive channel
VVFARLARAVLLIGAMLVVLPLIGVDLTVLSVFGGALGVGLGLGLQKIASNYLSGFIILLDRSIRLGDMITVDGHYGEVTRITTRYMVVRTLTGVEAIIPNDTLVTSTVLNHSYTDKRTRTYCARRQSRRERRRRGTGVLDRGSGAGQPERPFGRQRGDFAQVPGSRNRNSLSATGG